MSDTTETTDSPDAPGAFEFPDAPTWPASFAERYREKGYWIGETFTDMLRARAAQHPDRTAIVDPGSASPAMSPRTSSRTGEGADSEATTSGPASRRWSYADLERETETLARGFTARGIEPGDRVVVQLPNVAEFFSVIFALFRLGALPVFALPAHRESELRYFCEFTEARAIVVPTRDAGFDHAELARELRESIPTLEHAFVVTPTTPAQNGAEAPELPEVPSGCEALAAVAALGQEQGDAIVLPSQPRADQLAFLQLSGGSTGVPKLIPRTHDDYLYSVRGSNEICALDGDGVYLCVLPAAHNFPLSSPGTLGALCAGACVVLCPSPAPEVAFPLIAAEGVTITGLVPPLAIAWMDAAAQRDDDLGSLRTLLVGGAKLSEQVARRVRPSLGCTLQQVFGMAEGLVNYTRLDDPDEVIVTTQGRPISPDDEVLVLDDDDVPVTPGEAGHLLTRGPYTIRGYWRAPEHNARSFTADGFYRTGDIVRLTGDGNIIVEGRAKDQINLGGEKIAAEEVENHLLAHPAVFDANVVGEPDPYLGERSCAYVILRDGLPEAEADAGGRPGAESGDGAGAGTEADAAPTAVQLKRFVRSRGLAAYKVPDRLVFVTEFPQTGVGKISKKHLRTPQTSA